MTWQRTLTWTLFVIMAGGGLLALFLLSIPPTDETGRPDVPVIAVFISLTVMVVGGLGALLALILHRRWPALAGAKRAPADPSVAVRQGIILAATVGVLLMLALLDMLDFAFFAVTVIVAVLIEVFLQSRG